MSSTNLGSIHSSWQAALLVLHYLGELFFMWEESYYFGGGLKENIYLAYFI